MFGTDKVAIQVPPGPYPLCGDNCKGQLLPCVEPATAVTGPPAFVGPGVVPAGTPYWKDGTLVLFWKCTVCGRRV